jgi:uncharacterized cupin superfamily protein
MIESSPPALLAHPDPLTLELRRDAPLAIVAGEPRASVAELYRDDVVQCGVWEVTPGAFAAENAGFAENMHVLCGEATVTSDDGATVELRAGVAFVARSGWRGRWDVRETLRKTYVIWNAPDRPARDAR